MNIPFNDMTLAQQNYRVRQLWSKARLINQFYKMKHSSKEFNENQQTEDMNLDEIILTPENLWVWYIIRRDNTLPQIWDLIVNTFTVYAMFSTPLVLCFPEMQIELSSFERAVDFVFTLDIVLNFFKLSSN